MQRQPRPAARAFGPSRHRCSRGHRSPGTDRELPGSRGALEAASVDQAADSFDIHDDLVAVGQPYGWLSEGTDTPGRAGRNDVPGLERESLRTVAHDLAHSEVQIRGVCGLALLAVHQAADREIAR